MKKQGILCLAVLMACCMVFGGCNGNSASEAEKEPADVQAEREPADAQAESESAGVRTASGDLTFLIVYDSSKEELYKQFDAFRAEYPDINLTIEYMPSSDINKQLNTLIAADELPDLITLDGLDFASFASMGVFEDITERVNADLEVEQYYEAPMNSVQLDGKYYGLPFTSNCLALFYNKDMLEAAGYTEPPKDWNEFKQIAMDTTNPDGGVYGFACAGNASANSTFQWYPWMWANGGDVYDIDTPMVQGALQLYADMIQNGSMSKEILQWEQGGAAEAFIAGKAAMVTDGCWRLAKYEEECNFEWGVTTFPVAETGNWNTCLGGVNVGICRGGNVDAAWELLKFLNRPENMVDFNVSASYIPTRKDVAENTEYFNTGDMKVFSDSLAHAVSRGPDARWTEIETVLQPMLQSVIMGERTPEEATAWAKEQLQPVLAQ